MLLDPPNPAAFSSSVRSPKLNKNGLCCDSAEIHSGCMFRVIVSMSCSYRDASADSLAFVNYAKLTLSGLIAVELR